MAKLWEKGYEIDSFIATFILGDGHILDSRLIMADCVASIAHAKALHTAHILTEDEKKRIIKVLRDIYVRAYRNLFTITAEQEDCHTAIEEELTSTLGAVGKKIHTGRSRNDQVQVALRLVMKECVLRQGSLIAICIKELLQKSEEHKKTPMAGRTHMQIAMPSTAGLWFASIAEQLIDDLALLLGIIPFIDRSPLGSAAGYGTPITASRTEVSLSTGFAEVQNNVLAVQNSRGRLELLLADSFSNVMMSYSRYAQELIMYGMPEFGYFSLPKHLCSGSSIMPNKYNPDVLEMLRCRSAEVRSHAEHIYSSLRTLALGFQSDLADTKKPLFACIDTVCNATKAMIMVTKQLNVHPHKLKEGMHKDIFATDAVYELVKQGIPFREAYKTIVYNMDNIPSFSMKDVLATRKEPGTPGNLNLKQPKKRLAKLSHNINTQLQKHLESVKKMSEKHYGVLSLQFSSEYTYT